MRLFGNHESENQSISKPLHANNTSSAPLKTTDRMIANVSVLDAGEDHTQEIRELAKIAQRIAKYSHRTKIKTKLSLFLMLLFLLPIDLSYIYLSLFNFILHINITFISEIAAIFALFISPIAVIFTALLLITHPPSNVSGTLQKYSELAPADALPVLVKIIGERSLVKFPDAWEAFCIAFQKLGLEQTDSLLNSKDRKRLYSGLKKITFPFIAQPNRFQDTPFDDAYSDAILSLMERHPEDTPMKELKQLSKWAPWTIVERGRQILNRVTKMKSKRHSDPTQKRGLVGVLYSLASDDSSIQEKAANRLKSITPKEIPVLQKVLGKPDEILFLKTKILYPLCSFHLAYLPVPFLFGFCLYMVNYDEEGQGLIVLSLIYIAIVCPIFQAIVFPLLALMRLRLRIEACSVPWLRVIEALKAAENVSIINNLFETKHLLATSYSVPRAVREIIVDLLPRVSESGNDSVDLQLLKRQIDRVIPDINRKNRILNTPFSQKEDCRFVEALVNHLSIHGDSQSLELMQLLYLQLGFGESDKPLDLESCPDPSSNTTLKINPEQKQARIQLQITLNNAIQALQERIAEAVKSGSLLRPSSAPIQPDTLLRAAGNVSETPRDELLRPTSDSEDASQITAHFQMTEAPQTTAASERNVQPVQINKNN